MGHFLEYNQIIIKMSENKKEVNSGSLFFAERSGTTV